MEVSCGYYEYRVGEASLHEGALEGNVNGIKYVHHMYISTVWAILAWVYGRKITKQLKSGSRTGSVEQKNVKRYCYTACFMLTIR